MLTGRFAALSLAMLCARAHAGTPDVFLETIAPSDDTAAPQIRATVIAGPRGCRLHDGDIAIEPRTSTDYNPEEPIALVIVFNSQMMFVGNGREYDEWEPSVPGALGAMKLAFDTFDFGKLGPKSSEVTIVGYATGAEIKLPRSPLATLHGAAFGDLRDYRAAIGTDLVQGITLGLAELSKSKATRKALLVIGDGNDTNNAAAKVALADLRRRAHDEHVETFGIIYKDAISSDENVLANMIPEARVVGGKDGMVSELAGMMSRLTDRATYVFPGEALHWDAKPHALSITCGATLIAAELVLAPAWAAPKHRGNWPIVLLIGGVIALGIGVLLARRRA